MKLATKIVVGILLGIGVPISLLGTVEALNPNKSAGDREDAFLALIIFGLPPTALGSGLLWSNNRRSKQEERDRLRAAFFRLLQEQSGHLTVLRFSMETGLDGEDAKAYLDTRAKEFNAAYNVTEEGSFSYYFNLEGTKPLESG
jgi:hypothetical protein